MINAEETAKACPNCYQAHEKEKFERVKVFDDENNTWGIILMKGCSDHIKIASRLLEV